VPKAISARMPSITGRGKAWACCKPASICSATSPSQFPKDEVAFGATVLVRDLDMDETEEFTLVGAGEEDYDVGKILVTSPLAQGMMGKKVGDKVEIQVPRGVERFEIVEIRHAQ